MALNQGSAQDLAERREQLGQAPPPLARGEFGEPAQAGPCFHLPESLRPNRPQKANADLPGCEFPLSLLIQWVS